MGLTPMQTGEPMTGAQQGLKATQPGASTSVFVYRHKAAAATTGWQPFDPAANGATDISTDLKAEFRIDLVMGPIVAGEFRQQPGSAVLSWPFTEHAFLFEGSVEITDLVTGEKAAYGPGDGWIVKQGSRTLWNVLQPIRKSFFQYTE
ncbi:MAG: cupin domain-containing protein [Gammaproteobacteria bacterium]|nr:cupin domain-containing protein [Gammaproteobacteria bacterium]